MQEPLDRIHGWKVLEESAVEVNSDQEPRRVEYPDLRGAYYSKDGEKMHKGLEFQDGSQCEALPWYASHVLIYERTLEEQKEEWKQERHLRQNVDTLLEQGFVQTKVPLVWFLLNGRLTADYFRYIVEKSQRAPLIVLNNTGGMADLVSEAVCNYREARQKAGNTEGRRVVREFIYDRRSDATGGRTEEDLKNTGAIVTACRPKTYGNSHAASQADPANSGLLETTGSIVSKVLSPHPTLPKKAKEEGETWMVKMDVELPQGIRDTQFVIVDCKEDSKEEIVDKIITAISLMDDAEASAVGFQKHEKTRLELAWKMYITYRSNAKAQRLSAQRLHILIVTIALCTTLFSVSYDVLNGANRCFEEHIVLSLLGDDSAQYMLVLRWVVAALPVMSGFVFGVNGRFSPQAKYMQLETAASRVKTEMYEYRARVHEYRTVTAAPQYAGSIEELLEDEDSDSEGLLRFDSDNLVEIPTKLTDAESAKLNVVLKAVKTNPFGRNVYIYQHDNRENHQANAADPISESVNTGEIQRAATESTARGEETDRNGPESHGDQRSAQGEGKDQTESSAKLTEPRELKRRKSKQLGMRWLKTIKAAEAEKAQKRKGRKIHLHHHGKGKHSSKHGSSDPQHTVHPHSTTRSGIFGLQLEEIHSDLMRGLEHMTLRDPPKQAFEKSRFGKKSLFSDESLKEERRLKSSERRKKCCGLCGRFSLSSTASRVKPSVQELFAFEKHKSRRYAGSAFARNQKMADDGYQPITGDQYLTFRLDPEIQAYRKLAIKSERWAYWLQIIILLATASNAILAFAEQTVWMPVLVALTSSLQAYNDFERFGPQLTVANNALTKLENLRVWWESLSLKERRNILNREYLVAVTEANIQLRWSYARSRKKPGEQAGQSSDNDKDD
jgi:hypothetical protein